MGAITNILSLNKIEIKGPRKLKGTNVIATDLRGGASLLIAGLIAEGETTIDNSDYILRGYGEVVSKLKNVGAHIKLEE
jgi:UDP-N-acetylglucosamine 1-carboxyvinyltransferase